MCIFSRRPGTIALDAAGGNVDAIMPLFINQAMPDIFVVIFLLTLLTAAMSHCSALYHAMGTATNLRSLGQGESVRSRPPSPPLRHHPDDDRIHPPCLRPAHQYHRTGNRNVHGILRRCIPSGICYWGLRENSLNEGRFVQHDLRRAIWFSLDRICPYRRR